MNAEALRRELERGGGSIVAACAGLDDDEARWRPATGKWCLVEIVSHLLDEERDDFRARIRSTLDDPEAAWTPIDPEGWAQDRDYAARKLSVVLAAFTTERAASLEWLDGLMRAGVDWGRAHEHPHLGVLRAGDLFAAWVAHDQLHLAQLARWHLARVAASAAPFDARYAAP